MEYEKKLWIYDTRFHGAEPRPDGRRRGQEEPRTGPLVTRLRGYGTLCEGQLVAGPWGDISPHLHSLLKLCAELRVAKISLAQGWEAGLGVLGRVMGEIRRGFSVTVVRGAAICLLERLAQVPGQLRRGDSSPFAWRRGGGGRERPTSWPTRVRESPGWGGHLCPE